MPPKSGDSKREEFQKYLDKSGIMDAIARGLIKLYDGDNRPGPETSTDLILKLLGGVKTEEYEAALAREKELEIEVAKLEPEPTPSTTS